MTRALMVSLCSVGFFARFSYALARNPILPLFALFLGAQAEAVGLAVGISTVTGIFFKLPAGALSDVIGRRKTMLTGLGFFAIVPFAYFFIDHYSTLVLVRFLHGFATAIYGPVAMAVIADVAGKQKGEMLSWFSSIAVIGTLVGAPTGGLLLSILSRPEHDITAFRVIYAVVAVSGVTAFCLGAKTLLAEEHTESHAGSSRLAGFLAGIREVAGDTRVIATSAVEGIQNMALGMLEAFLPVYAVTVAGLSPFQAGMLWTVQIFATMAAKPVMGRYSDRYGRKYFIVGGLLCCALPVACIPQMGSFWPLMLACLMFGFGEALVTSSSAAMVADFCKAGRYGTAMGVFGTIYDIGHAAGPILGGLLVGSLGYAAAFALTGGALLLAAPLFLHEVRTWNKGI